MGLPVDPQRLKQQFPDLSDDDLEAYVAITKQVLADPATKGRAMRAVMETGRAAAEKAQAGQGLSRQETLALRYVRAVEKMQAPLAPPRSRKEKK